MKIRTGFVSNSSSSSFVCDICGEQASGYDLGLEEVGMRQCKKSHTFCDSHMTTTPPDISTAKKKELLLSICGDDEQGIQDREQLSNNNLDLLDEMWEELKYEFSEYYNLRDECETKYCPCCTLVSPTDKQILKYLYKKHNTTKAKVVKEMRGAK